MNPLIENLTGMNTMTDPIIASDFLMAIKTGIKLYATALTETATPELREALRKQLQDAIVMHEAISSYMINKGLYHPYNPVEQLNLDIQAAGTAINLPS